MITVSNSRTDYRLDYLYLLYVSYIADKFIYIVLVVGLYVLSLDILISYWISEMRLGYVVVILVYSMGILLYLTLFETPNVNVDDFEEILSIHPYYNLVQSLMHTENLSEITMICSDEQSFETSVYLEQCQKIPNCCGE